MGAWMSMTTQRCPLLLMLMSMNTVSNPFNPGPPCPGSLSMCAKYPSGPDALFAMANNHNVGTVPLPPTAIILYAHQKNYGPANNWAQLCWRWSTAHDRVTLTSSVYAHKCVTDPFQSRVLCGKYPHQLRTEHCMVLSRSQITLVHVANGIGLWDHHTSGPIEPSIPAG